MAQAQFYVGDFGLTIRLTAVDAAKSPENISAATQVQFEFVKPSQAVVTKTAAFTTDGSDGKAEYTIESGLLDEAGKWSVRMLITEGGSKSFRSAKWFFEVGA